MRSFHRSATVLATLALGLAACGGGEEASSDPETSSVSQSNSDTVAVTGTNALKFDPVDLSASAGEVTFELTSESGVNHNLVIEELNDLTVVEAAAGATEAAAVSLDAGTYTYYCSIEGHRAAGMEGTLTVS